MQKIALPIIFVAAAAAALFYVSREAHGAGTLTLLAAVLVVGQICATLPFILEAKKPRAETPPPPSRDDEAARKILANQQVIHEDLRSLGETLVRRLAALAERQNEIEKNVLAARDVDVADDLDDFFGKIGRAFDERFENLPEAVGEKIAPQLQEFREKIDAAEKRLAELRAAAEKIAAAGPARDEAVPETAPRGDEGCDATDGVPADFPGEKEAAENETAEEPFPPDEDAPFLDDFPEEDDAETPPRDETPDAGQGELPLGDFPPARGATLVLDAMLGIENKPFLRGNAPGLSETAGTPMTFVEIGRWSHDFDALNREVSVRILRNDNEDEPLGDPVTLAPGQKLELAYVPEKP